MNDEPALTITVRIIAARGLREAAWAGAGRSERFCTCEVPGKPTTRITTPAVADTDEPSWNYEADIAGYDFGDPLIFRITATSPHFASWKTCLGLANVSSHVFEAIDCYEGEIHLKADAQSEDFLQKAVEGRLACLKVKITSQAEAPEPEVSPALAAEAPLEETPLEEELEEELEDDADDVPPGSPTEPRPKQRQAPPQREPRPVVVPAILEQCIHEANEAARLKKEAEENEEEVGPEVGDEEVGAEVVKRLEDLPSGWEAAWDDAHQRYYFYNHELGESTWDWPDGTRQQRRKPFGRSQLH